ncbi:MAG TPA: APC family permease, partial [Planctomycetota bacterium]|nr:APC family permease [Planctomycetota bacterium]
MLTSGSSTRGSPPTDPGLWQRLRRACIGAPRDLGDAGALHKLSLIAVLAWVGLGADALSSSAYGPEEAFKAIGLHTHLALPLALATAATVFMIAAAYSKVIEVFPNGGGYGVATRLLGSRVGVVSGSALLVDYVLTITASIAAMGDALFSLLPPSWQGFKLPAEAATIVGLTVLNLRGVRESIVVLAPVFLLFLVTHVLLIVGGCVLQFGHIGEAFASLHAAAVADQSNPALGFIGLLAILLNAYALGGGTYTGIEAVSNALPLMREPRVQTAKRTMIYLSVSLAITAGGLIVCYLLWDVHPEVGKTMNAVLAARFGEHLPAGGIFVFCTLVAEGLLLVVAAQAGFVGGPRVMANMAVDGWMPRHFATLSDRLTTENGVLVMGALALAGLLWTHGQVDAIVVMYAINVFVTFALTMAGMCRYWLRQDAVPRWQRRRRLLLFGGGLCMCGTILVITLVEKFTAGAWVTVLVTGALVCVCFAVRNHYRYVLHRLHSLYRDQELPPSKAVAPSGRVDATQPVAVVLVSSYGGPGIHTTMRVPKMFPDYFRGMVFCSIGVLDSGDFKGHDALAALKERTTENLARYVELANTLGLPATSRMAISTDAV